MNGRLKDSVCVVTGAAQDISFVVAERVGQGGGRLAVSNRRPRRHVRVSSH
jgi:NAD(P)-dependent dehydrogenase (short-subunit alcohol dehydrogenase family)